MKVVLWLVVAWTTAAAAFLNPALGLTDRRTNSSIGMDAADFSSVIGSNSTGSVQAAAMKMFSVLNDVVPKSRSQLFATLPKHSSEIVLEYFKKFEEETRIHLGKTPEELGKKLGNFQVDFWYEAGARSDEAKTWILNNPKKAVAIAGSIVAPPIAAMAVFPIIAGAGFTASGIAAGSIAASVQSTIGNVGAGSLFAILQSAGAGGAGAATIGTSVWGGTTAACWGTTAGSFLKDSMRLNEKTDGGDRGTSEPKERQSKL